MPARYPSLYEINTRVWLTELGRRLGRPVTLDDIPDSELDRIAAMGFDWVWLLSVWRIGVASLRVSRSVPELRAEFARTLPDLRDDDIAGSGFAITGYVVSPSLGGDPALARLRSRLGARGVRLMLDFVPNHVALDHPWIDSHPEYFIAGSEEDLQREPQNYTRVATAHGPRIFAYGRDPNYAGWTDTLQLDYSHRGTQLAMAAELAAAAARCDGLRCDMAMLLLPEIFERTWGRRPDPFWPRVIPELRARIPGFCLLAEVYWDLEWRMQQEGFDYAYDKRLYDRLREQHARPVREHLHAGLDYQDRLARFLENHDEPRAAAAFTHDVHEAAAIVTFLSPGLRFFHEGQLEGRRARLSTHLIRAPKEPRDEELSRFYERLLTVLRRPAVRSGHWHQLECVAAWDGNGTWDGFLVCAWDGVDDERLVVAVNYAPTEGQCYVRLPFVDSGGSSIRFTDLMSEARYDRASGDLASQGLYLDLPAWGYHVFSVAAANAPA